MSTCTKWVTEVVQTCKNWASETEQTCSDWLDEGSQQCQNWADEGSQQCQNWIDEGSNQCSAWNDCSWTSPWDCVAGAVCIAVTWVAKWVCKAWAWVAKWVCKAWAWVAKWVCKAWAWVVVAICVVWSWVASLVCVAWDTLRCMLVAITKWLAGLFGARQATPRVEHVFVLMLENRSFDHMFGFSGLTGVDENGAPTSVIGVDLKTDFNFDSSTHQKVGASNNPAADFALKSVDQDPGHEFEDTLMALCARFDEEGNLLQPAPAYNPVPGGYPPITNGGFVENYMH